jgi:hypothetical protein
VGEAAILQASLTWRSAPTERFSESLPRGILPSGLLFVTNHTPTCEGIEVAPLNGQELQTFCSGQMKASAVHASSLGEG